MGTKIFPDATYFIWYEGADGWQALEPGNYTYTIVYDHADAAKFYADYKMEACDFGDYRDFMVKRGENGRAKHVRVWQEVRPRYVPDTSDRALTEFKRSGMFGKFYEALRNGEI